MPPLILVVEDDPMQSDVVRMNLEQTGYRVAVASDGLDGLTQALSTRPALVVLDIMLPRLDGWEVLRQLREVSQLPVIVLTARGEEQEKVKGFTLGADDYVTKPFSMQEFLARVGAVLKRTANTPPEPAPLLDSVDEDVLTFPSLIIDNRRHRVERSGQFVALTPKEFELLWYLAARAGTVVRREELIQSVWGYGRRDDDRTIHTHVNRLRSKLDVDGHRYVHTVWGVGYMFDAAQV